MVHLGGVLNGVIALATLVAVIGYVVLSALLGLLDGWFNGITEGG